MIARASIASALGSHMTSIAASTRSRFAIGSPIPWNTTPWTRSGERCPRGRPQAARRPNLLDDLPRLEISKEPHPAGRAERTRQRAADLRAHADGETARALERNADRLDDVAIRGPERVLHERVELARALCCDLEPRHPADPDDRLTRDAADRPSSASTDPRHDGPARPPVVLPPARSPGTARTSSCGRQPLQRDTARRPLAQSRARRPISLAPECPQHALAIARHPTKAVVLPSGPCSASAFRSSSW